MTRGLLVAATQHLALPIDEVHASASLAGDPLVIVLGRIFIIVQPVLDLHASDRTSEEQCGHRSNIRPFQTDLTQNGSALHDSEIVAGESFPDG